MGGKGKPALFLFLFLFLYRCCRTMGHERVLTPQVLAEPQDGLL